MALEFSVIQDKLVAAFGEDVHFAEKSDIYTIVIPSELVVPVVMFLKNDETLRFNFLTDLAAVHYPDNEVDKQFCMVYLMHNWVDNVRIRIKCFLNGEKPEVKTLTNVFLSANWMEREAYDFFGVNFIGHPQLKRILTMDEMVSFPMRKEFPMEDGGRTDKDDRFFGRTVANKPVQDQVPHEKN